MPDGAEPKLPRVSNSSLDIWRWCPRQYRYHYVERVAPDHPKMWPSGVYGKAFHALVSDMYKFQAFDLQAMLDKWPYYFDRQVAVDKFVFKGEDTRKKWFNSGPAVLTNFYNVASEKGLLVAPIRTEWRFKLSFEDFIVIGVVDLIIRPFGVRDIEVLDFKTGVQPKESVIDEDDQLTFYDMAAKKELGLDVRRVGLFYPRDSEIKYSVRTDEHHQKLIADIRAMIAKIAEKDFTPTYKDCHFCPFNRRCAAEDMAARSGASLDWFYDNPLKDKPIL